MRTFRKCIQILCIPFKQRLFLTTWKLAGHSNKQWRRHGGRGAVPPCGFRFSFFFFFWACLSADRSVMAMGQAVAAPGGQGGGGGGGQMPPYGFHFLFFSSFFFFCFLLACQPPLLHYENLCWKCFDVEKKCVGVPPCFPTNNRTFSERSKNVPSWFFGRFVKTLFGRFFWRFWTSIKRFIGRF